MIIRLLKLRLRSMLSGLRIHTGTGVDQKAAGAGKKLLFVFLGLYLAASAVFMMGLMFHSLAEPYHMAGLDWLYFAMAGVMSLGFSLFGSVFSTQNQLYDAKDNDLLLSMPIKPSHILLSRMAAVLLINLAIAALILIPAFAVYFIFVGFSVRLALLMLPAILFIALFSMTLSCLFGWLLHLLLKHFNRSFGAMLFMVLFLGLYFWVYSQATDILNALVVNSQGIANTLSWVWPLYAFGRGCADSLLYFLGFAAVSAGVFFLIHRILSATFLKTTTASSASARKKKLDLSRSKAGSLRWALVRKELRKFLATPIFLTNMGVGLVLLAALGILGIVFESKVSALLATLTLYMGDVTRYIPLFICAVICFLNGTCGLSVPTVSLEGKNIWIPKSLPISPRQILQSKLMFHLILTVPTAGLSSLLLALTYGCSLLETVLVVCTAALYSVFCGCLGLVCGLRWAKLDYISQSHPCKQSMAVTVNTLATMFLPLVLGLAYYALMELMSVPVFLSLLMFALAGASMGLYRLILTWGVAKWQSLN